MKRLPPDKRNKLVLVTGATLGLIGMVYFFLIGPQKEQNQKLGTDLAADLARLQQVKQTVKQAEVTTARVGEISQLLARAEDDSAAGDVFSWTYDTIRQFRTPYHIEINSVSQPIPSDVDLIANCPYKQIKFQIIGSGYYHDIGKFIADLENKFPHMRVTDLNIDTAASPDGQGEKLTFRVDIAALVKPNS
jgi:hypothetical protein